MQAFRAAYRAKRAEIAEEALIFIDESGATLDLTRLLAGRLEVNGPRAKSPRVQEGGSAR